MTSAVSLDQISRLAIVGAGNMGSSIAVAISILGLPITLLDTNIEVLKNSLERINKFFEKLEDKADGNKALIKDLKERRSLITSTQVYEDLAEVDLVIEAVNEDIDVKKIVLQKLDAICPKNAIFASNTSSFSITQLASFTKRDKQVIGLHFFNPAHLMNLVEIVPGLNTTPQVIDLSFNFVGKLQKLAVKVEECASFLVNRLLSRYINEAIWILQDGVSDIETIDRSACDFMAPIGPLQLRDMNGLDIGLAVALFNYTEYGERFRPPALLEKMVALGLLGKKSRAGFYIYESEKNKPSSVNQKIKDLVQPQRNLPAFEPIQLFLPMINEVFLILQEKIVAPENIDPALRAGLGFKQGLMEFAFDYGLGRCLDKIENLYQIYGERFRPAPLLKRYVWAGKKSLV